MRVVCFCLGLLLAGCRPPLPPPGGLDGGLDAGAPDMLSLATPDCTKAPDCYACCAGVYESGALDFTSATQGCACDPPAEDGPCAGPCASTLCGSALGVNAACQTCIDGLAVDGGACQQQISDCITFDGPCGAWKTCSESCAGAGTS